MVFQREIFAVTGVCCEMHGCRGYSPPYALYAFQSIDCGKTLLSMLLSAMYFLLITLSAFPLLHDRCASCRFCKSDGCPPFDMGMMWSTVGLIGSGNFSEKSTGFPHISQIVCVAYIVFLFLSNAALNVPSLSGLFLAYLPCPIFIPFSCLMHIGNYQPES